MAVVVGPTDWDALRRAQPAVEQSLLALHQRIKRAIDPNGVFGRHRIHPEF
jgi:FAD/FMN-containing dehydrogenase